MLCLQQPLTRIHGAWLRDRPTLGSTYNIYIYIERDICILHYIDINMYRVFVDALGIIYIYIYIACTGSELNDSNGINGIHDNRIDTNDNNHDITINNNNTHTTGNTNNDNHNANNNHDNANSGLEIKSC